jgi:hypothetical protein
VLLYATQLVDVEDALELPPGWTATLQPEASSVDETYAAFSGSSETSPGRLVVRSRTEVRRRQIPPDGYEGFTRAITAARDWADALFRVEREGGAR